MKNEDTVESILKVAGDKQAMRARLDFMFFNEPLANRIKKYCQISNLSDEEMYQLIVLGFMVEKNKRTAEDFIKASQSLSHHACSCEVYEDCPKCRQQ